QNDVTLKMPAFEWVHVQLHQQKGMISLSPPTICNSALSGIAEFERDLISERVKSGLAVAKARGKRLGRQAGVR
ncbi:recombinase family protein, partial [Escherichia coli]|nr:recombinase family protein [Escherichia coli]